MHVCAQQGGLPVRSEDERRAEDEEAARGTQGREEGSRPGVGTDQQGQCVPKVPSSWL